MYIYYKHSPETSGYALMFAYQALVLRNTSVHNTVHRYSKGTQKHHNNIILYVCVCVYIYIYIYK